MGNNMAVRRTAYDAVGGYENLPFTVVEDYQLFTEIIQHRFSFGHLFNREVLATTRPLPDWKSWLQQRKRWMIGALQLPVYFCWAVSVTTGLLSDPDRSGILVSDRCRHDLGH
jgi:cellulose synthase/poly-beta-1,6-N-acetylglucosamine synthase-like glycosyltransferase